MFTPVFDPAKRKGSVPAAIPAFIAATNAQPGCVRFVVSEDVGEACRFTVFGEFESRDALYEHENSSHVDTFREVIKATLENGEPTLVYGVSEIEPLTADFKP